MTKKILNSFGLTLLSSGLFFIFNFAIAKLLGANEYGKISYYLSFVQILTLLIGLNYASLYMGNKITREDVNTFSLFFTIESLFFTVIFLPSYFILENFIEDTIVIVLILLSSYTSVIISTIGLEFNAQKKVEKSILHSALLPRMLLVFIFLFFYIVDKDETIFYFYALFIANFIIYLLFLYRFKPKFYLKKDIFTRAWKFYLLGIIGSSFQPVANILQKEFYGYKELATLSIVLLILAGVYMFGSVLVKFVLPKIHEAWKNKDLKLIEKLYANNTKLEIIVIGPLIVFIVANIEYFANFLGEDYNQLPTYLYILMIGFIPDFFTGITGNLLRSTENEKYEILNEIILFISGVVLIFLLKDNSYGVIYAIAISMLLYNLVKFLEVHYLLKIKPFNLKELFLLWFYLVVLFVVFFYLKNSIGVMSIFISLFLLVINGYYVYGYINRHNLLKGFE